MSPKPPVMALTGSIGSGKSTVLKRFQKLGASVLSADELARELVTTGSPAFQEIIDLFGEAILSEDGSLNRKALGRIVFQDAKKRAELESILHPKIRTLSTERIRQLQEMKLPPSLIIYEIPLFFESKLSYPEIDGSILVYAPSEVCIQRVVERDPLSPEEAKERLDAQISIEEKRELADYVIDNTGDLETLYTEVERLYKSLIAS